jgi:hypothetical protein
VPHNEGSHEPLGLTVWEETLAGNGQAYRSDASLVSKIIAAAYALQPSASPSEGLVDSLSKQTKLASQSIRDLFKKHHEHAQKAARWETPHRAAAAVGCRGNDNGGDVRVDNGVIKYDASLVGRRCTALWIPEEGEEGEEGYYAATIVAYNSRAAARIGRFLLHFDDGQRERVGLPDHTVRVMTARVSFCSCKESLNKQPGCCKGVGGKESLPRPWEDAR